jgi:hypothetical protein
MAELALKHISTSIYYSSKTAPNKEYIRTTELFFDKVFGDHKKYNHDFATINGVFSVKRCLRPSFSVISAPDLPPPGPP